MVFIPLPLSNKSLTNLGILCPFSQLVQGKLHLSGDKPQHQRVSQMTSLSRDHNQYIKMLFFSYMDYEIYLYGENSS